MTIQQIMTAHKQSGGHFFDKDTLRFFKSRILETVYQGPGGIYFVTSERFEFRDDSHKRGYTVRKFTPKTFSVDTAGEFNELTKYMAQKIATELSIKPNQRSRK